MKQLVNANGEKEKPQIKKPGGYQLRISLDPK